MRELSTYSKKREQMCKEDIRTYRDNNFNKTGENGVECATDHFN